MFMKPDATEKERGGACVNRVVAWAGKEKAIC